MKTNIDAIQRLLGYEILQDYDCKYTIEYIGNENFLISFDLSSFNDITIRVDNINHEDLEFSEFSINIYDDIYESFSCNDWSVKELWKGLLWK